MPTTSCETLHVISFETATTCRSIKQATHNVWSCRVTMAEAEEDLVAYLWDKYKTTVTLYVTTTTAIWGHHTHPTCLHAIRLPVHTYTYTTLSLWVSIAKHGCHLCLCQWHTHLWTWHCLYCCRDSLEAVFVVASLAHLVGYLDDAEVTQILFGNISYMPQERIVDYKITIEYCTTTTFYQQSSNIESQKE